VAGGRALEPADEYPGDVSPRALLASGAVAVCAAAGTIWLVRQASLVGSTLLWVTLFAAAAAIALALTPAILSAPTIRVGHDGVSLIRPRGVRWIAWARVESVIRPARLKLVEGRPVHLSSPGKDAYRKRFHALVDHLERALAAYREAPTVDADASRVEPGHDGPVHWLAKLEAVERGADYRSAGLSRDQLMALVESPHTAPLARVGAAAAVARDATGAERDRLVMAGSACASVVAFSALHALADEDPDVIAILALALRG